MSKATMNLWLGVSYALAAGLAWGLVFLAPLLLADYSPAMLTFGRYCAFGVISLSLAWWSRKGLAALEQADWVEALKLSLVGNILYYLALSAAIQFADAPMPTLIIGTLPVVIALSTNVLLSRRERKGMTSAENQAVPYRRLVAPLITLFVGLLLVNHAEKSSGQVMPLYGWGIVLAVLAMLCWTWYPIRNSLWLKRKPHIEGGVWATVQGLTTLPLALVGIFVLTIMGKFDLGAQPAKYIGTMFAIGLLASWAGTWCWNRASQLLPTALAGQLIVFETLAALLYAYLFRGKAPDTYAFVGIGLLLIGVLLALRVFNRPSTTTGG